jgi:hypothetical protein
VVDDTNGELVAVDFETSEEFATMIDRRWWRRCCVNREGANPIRDADVIDIFSFLLLLLLCFVWFCSIESI